MKCHIKSVQEGLQHPEIFRVSIFGSARTEPHQEVYKDTYKLGYELGKRDIGVVTGGGPGQMEAANKGHKDTSSCTNSIGLTIALPWEGEHNRFLDTEGHFKKFGNRLDHFMALSNAIVLTAGGIGTCLEFFYTLQLTQVKHIHPIPIILMNPIWEDLYTWIKKDLVTNGYVSEKDLDNIFVAKNTEEALEIIDKEKAKFDKLGTEAPSNIKIYNIKSVKS